MTSWPARPWPSCVASASVACACVSPGLREESQIVECQQRRERHQQRESPKRATVKGDAYQDSGRERDPACTSECEVERREQRNQERRRGGTGSDNASVQGEAEREHRSDRRERRETIPVAERLREPVGRCRVVDAKNIRQHPRPQTEKRDRPDRAQQAAEQVLLRSPAADEHEHRRRRHVDERSLDLEHRLREIGGPDGRQRDPSQKRSPRQPGTALAPWRSALSVAERSSARRPRGKQATSNPMWSGSSRLGRRQPRRSTPGRVAPAASTGPAAGRCCARPTSRRSQLRSRRHRRRGR